MYATVTTPLLPHTANPDMANSIFGFDFPSFGYYFTALSFLFIWLCFGFCFSHCLILIEEMIPEFNGNTTSLIRHIHGVPFREICCLPFRLRVIRRFTRRVIWWVIWRGIWWVRWRVLRPRITMIVSALPLASSTIWDFFGPVLVLVRRVCYCLGPVHFWGLHQYQPDPFYI